jgi:hypothetical protein
LKGIRNLEAEIESIKRSAAYPMSQTLYDEVAEALNQIARKRHRLERLKINQRMGLWFEP